MQSQAPSLYSQKEDSIAGSEYTGQAGPMGSQLGGYPGNMDLSVSPLQTPTGFKQNSLAHPHHAHL